MSSTLDMSHLERSPLNVDAEQNVPPMLVTLDTSQLEMSPLNDDAKLNMPPMSVTLDTSHLEMSPLNDDKEANMPCMSVTLNTCHLEISPVNLFAPRTRLSFSSKNNQLMSLTGDTSQDPISPCGPFEHSDDSCRHSTMAAWSFALDFGAHAVVGHFTGYTVGVSGRVRIILRFRVRVRVRFSVRVRIIIKFRVRVSVRVGISSRLGYICIRFTVGVDY